MKKTMLFLIAIPFVSTLLVAQSISPDLLTRQWEAKWLSVPGEPQSGYGVYLFRKTFEIQQVPPNFIIHVSADNRYKLYVNEKLVSVGPARGDFYYWNFETVDLTPYLVPGRNVLAAKVWNEGELRPEAQISWRTGFIMQGNTPEESIVNTNTTWKCSRDNSYSPLSSPEVIGYFVTGPGEFIRMEKHIRDWASADFDDSGWAAAEQAYWRGGSPKGLRDAFGWMLVPSVIPQMELSVERLQRVRESSVEIPPSFPLQRTSFTIPAHTRANILLDQGYLTNAYPTLEFSRGRNAAIRIKYAEALFIPAGTGIYGTLGGGYMGHPGIHGKGNRNEIAGKVFLGRKDSLLSDGTHHQVFTTLYWRTFRYVLLTVETQDDPLVVEDFYGTFTGYPFQLKTKFQAENPELQQVLDIGWRTARLCALETYVDCPYYEQLQYIGDTRIQAMISFYNSGDDRLVRNALNLMDHSRIAEGLALSRHPSYSPQLIPTFALWYIGMLHDFWMYRPDDSFVREKLGGTRQILEFFHRYQQEDGSLKHVPYWNFTDWVEDRKGWSGGVAPVGADGSSAVMDFQLLLAYQTAAELEKRLGMEAYAQLYDQRAGQLKAVIQQKYWDTGKGLYADRPEKDVFSQHANTLAILTGMVSGEESVLLARKMQSEPDMATASIYFKYYLHRAYIRAGLGDDYLKWLGMWHENIAMGLTTWSEDSNINTARSDCHAWGSSPNIEFYRTILGIDTDAPGFASVKIEPHPGDLQAVAGEVPHPRGMIRVKMERIREKWHMEVDLPEGLPGRFLWKGREVALKSGKNNMVL